MKTNYTILGRRNNFIIIYQHHLHDTFIDLILDLLELKLGLYGTTTNKQTKIRLNDNDDDDDDDDDDDIDDIRGI